MSIHDEHLRRGGQGLDSTDVRARRALVVVVYCCLRRLLRQLVAHILNLLLALLVLLQLLGVLLAPRLLPAPVQLRLQLQRLRLRWRVPAAGLDVRPSRRRGGGGQARGAAQTSHGGGGGASRRAEHAACRAHHRIDERLRARARGARFGHLLGEILDLVALLCRERDRPLVLGRAAVRV